MIEEDDEEEYKEDMEKRIEIKAILLGNSGVGKTNIINTCVGLNFESGNNPTSSGSFVSKNIKLKDKSYIINLWDTAGQERYKSITKIFLKKSEIVFFVYDITDKKSFIDLQEWIDICKEMIDNEYVGAIVGNKIDLYLNEQVNEDEALKFAENNGLLFKLISAKKEPKVFVTFLKELIEEREGILKGNSKEHISIRKDIVENKKPCNC